MRIIAKFNDENWDVNFVRPCDLTDYKRQRKTDEPSRSYGDCVMPLSPKPKHRLTRKERIIRLDKTLDSSEMLDTALHEAIHAAMPFLNEEWVDAPITDIAKFLEKIGYRRIDDAE